MNGFKKIYCRIFQLCFRAALPVLPYREPKILEDMEALGQVLAEQGKRSVLIVTDKGISGLGLLGGLKEALAKAGIAYTVYDDTVPNPTIDNVEQARTAYLANQCSAIVAFGGGSSIDCAKAAGARIAKPRQSVQKMNFSLIPRYAVLDYHVTTGLPRQITATTGMDALTHAVEAYIGGSTTKLTRRMAQEAVCLIRDNLKKAYDNGQDAQAREDIPQMAAHADKESNPLYPVPRLMDAGELACMCRKISSGKASGEEPERSGQKWKSAAS